MKSITDLQKCIITLIYLLLLSCSTPPVKGYLSNNDYCFIVQMDILTRRPDKRKILIKIKKYGDQRIATLLKPAREKGTIYWYNVPEQKYIVRFSSSGVEKNMPFHSINQRFIGSDYSVKEFFDTIDKFSLMLQLQDDPIDYKLIYDKKNDSGSKTKSEIELIELCND